MRRYYQIIMLGANPSPEVWGEEQMNAYPVSEMTGQKTRCAVC